MGVYDPIDLGSEFIDNPVPTYCNNCGYKSFDCICIKEETPEAKTQADLNESFDKEKEKRRLRAAAKTKKAPPLEHSAICYYCARKEVPLVVAVSSGALICEVCAINHLGDEEPKPRSFHGAKAVLKINDKEVEIFKGKTSTPAAGSSYIKDLQGYILCLTCGERVTFAQLPNYISCRRGHDSKQSSFKKGDKINSSKDISPLSHDYEFDGYGFAPISPSP